MPARFAAIVLAAGSATRMGDANKLLADVDGAPIVRHVLHALSDPRIVDRVIVTGHDAEAVRATLTDDDVRFIHNAEYAAGISTSIRAGVAALAGDLDAALIAPGDMPWLTSGDVRTILDAFEPAGPATVWIPIRNERRGNPVLWARSHFPALLRLTGDIGGRQLFPRLGGEIREVPVGGRGVLMDVDTPAALDAARRAEGEGE